LVHTTIVNYSVKYLLEKGIRLRTDPSAWEHKIRIVKYAREHKNSLYPDNKAYWYDRSINVHDLYNYIAFLIKLEEITELESLLGIKDRYFGYFRVFRNYRSHFNSLKAYCKAFTVKYKNSKTFNFVRFRIKIQDNKDIISLEAGIREKLILDTKFTNMDELNKIINEANETMRYYAEIGKLKI
jgi:hypothetical protein